MSYTRPGVTVRQVQNTASFPLPAPTLKSCVVGPGYYYFSCHEGYDAHQEKVDANYVYSGTSLVINTALLVGMDDYTNLLADSIVIDLYRNGKLVRLEKTTDFTISGANITIAANVGGAGEFTAAVGMTGQIRISFLTENKDIVNTYTEIFSESDIKNYISGPANASAWFNPLAYGVSLAMQNGGRASSVVGVATSTGGETPTYGDAKIALETKDVYAIAPMTRTAAQILSLANHATEMALPDNKLERIVFGSPKRTFTLGTPPTNEQKAADATSVANYAIAINNKRYFAIYPDVAWVYVNTHIATLKSTFLTAVFGADMPAPRFVSTITLGGITYNPDDEISSTALAAWETAIEATNDPTKVKVNALVPVPGYYLAAALAGQTAAKRPEEPLTNRGVSGFYGVYRSNEVFRQSHLDTMAGGGTWIFETLGPDTVVTRHQLSTAATTVQTRELSVTTQIDYAAKFLRSLVSPLIGKFVISDGFIKNLQAALAGGAVNLVQNGYLRDLKVVKVYQDTDNPDTIHADFDLLPLYPLNYIKITLTF